MFVHASIACSTAQRIPIDAKGELTLRAMSDTGVNPFFRAVIEAVNESVISSMLAADTVTGRAGHTRPSLREFAGRVAGLPAESR